MSRNAAARSTPVLRVTLALGFGLLGRLPAQAQWLEQSLEPGARVRVTLADPSGEEKRVIGRLVRADADSLDLDVGEAAERRDIRPDAIVRLEKSLSPSRKPYGALVGFAAGFMTMFTVYATHHSDCLRGGGCADQLITRSALMALPAAALGAMAAPGERWADLPLGRAEGRAAPASNARVRLQLVPLTGGDAALAVSVRF